MSGERPRDLPKTFLKIVILSDGFGGEFMLKND
jgi:hypothetical protein